MSINLDVSDFLTKSSDLKNKIVEATRAYAETEMQRLVSTAKQEAPWDDISTLSRQTISGQVTSFGNTQRISLIGGTTEQFKYLELAHEKRYAIIQPTMLKLAPGIIKGWRRVIK